MSGRGRPKKGSTRTKKASSEAGASELVLEDQRKLITTLRRKIDRKQKQFLQLMDKRAASPIRGSALSEIKLLTEELRSSTHILTKHVGSRSAEAREEELYLEELEEFYAEWVIQIPSKSESQKGQKLSTQATSVVSQASRKSKVSVSSEAAQMLAEQLQKLDRSQQELQLQAKQMMLDNEAQKNRILLEALKNPNIEKEDWKLLQRSETPKRTLPAVTEEPIFPEGRHDLGTLSILPQEVYVNGKVPQPVLHTSPAQEITPENKDLVNHTGSNSALILMTKVQVLNSLIPHKFSGDSTDFPLFRSQIRTHLEDGILPEGEKRVFLAKFLEGQALKVFQDNFGLSYGDSVALLERKFGNSVAVTEAWVTRLTEGPSIGLGDSKGLEEYAEALCTATRVLSEDALKELSTKMCLKKMVSRLPSSLVPKWIAQINKLNGKETVHDLASFTETQAKIRNHPVYINSEKDNKSYNIPSKSSKSRRNMAVSVQELKSPQKGPLKSGNAETCVFCQNTHKTVECSLLAKEPPDKIKEFVQRRGLCFGCLLPGHRSKFCPKRAVCNVKECSKNHPTALHSLKPEKLQNIGQAGKQTLVNENSKSVSRLIENSVMTSTKTTAFILPVYVHHEQNPGNRKLVYALLDDGSDTCFLSNSLKIDLGCKGVLTGLELSTIHQKSNELAYRVPGLVISRFDNKDSIVLPDSTYSRDMIPGSSDEIPTPEIAECFEHLKPISKEIQPLMDETEIKILIGNNCPKALCPLEVRKGGDYEPYAVRTALGWGIIGPRPLRKNRVTDTLAKSRLSVREIINIFNIEQHNNELKDYKLGLSVNDKKFLDVMTKGVIQRKDKHYEMPLPVKNPDFKFPLNKELAIKRLNSLKIKFKNPKFKSDYVAFMKDMFDNGHAEPADHIETEEGKVWYLPHHGVYHPKKKKIRIVFDCSAAYKGISLNNNLISSPDLTNSVVGVLVRLRQERIAFIGDLEGMFLQVVVPEEDRNLLRFLWWEEGETESNHKEFRMTKHLFGAASSPGCANFALRKTAEDHGAKVSERATRFIFRNFYMDDGCGSVATVEEALTLIKELQTLCSLGGFRFHKLLSTSPEVVKQIPKDERASGLKEFDNHGTLPLERALGIAWCVQSDRFLFKIQIDSKPCTRRGMLSTLCSTYDPLGFLAPFVMTGKIILQDLTRECINSNIDWDDPVPEGIAGRWNRWLGDLTRVDELDISVPRCYKSADMSQVKGIELHHFADASLSGYGHVSYLRFLYDKDKIHCSFIFGKARVRPLREVTVPRLELTAAVSVALASESLSRELDYTVTRYFWTDSRVVLGYIKNETKRFHTFVANRIQTIRDCSEPQSWHHVISKSNPADFASRGLSAEDLQQSRWFVGPEFLYEHDLPLEDLTKPVEIEEGDPEIRKSTLREVQGQTTFAERYKQWSSWNKLKRAIAVALRFLAYIRAIVRDEVKPVLNLKVNPLNVVELKAAEIRILATTQNEFFAPEISQLLMAEADSAGGRGRVKSKIGLKNSTLRKLTPVLDKVGLLRVGGRVQNTSILDFERNPIILPKGSWVTYLVIKHFHEKIKHQGRGFTLNEIRAQGFWLVKGPSAVARHISQCVECRRLRGPFVVQRMGDLPRERVDPSPPFTYTAADAFGPFFVCQGRSKVKRYGLVFTCLSSRAVHIEVLNTMNTDSFLNALRRFLSRRGEIRLLRTDSGTNFIGGKEELNRAKVQRFLADQQCQFEFKITTPKASHTQGVVERQIGSIRRILDHLLKSYRGSLTDDCLCTLLVECEAIINSRPLSVESINDPHLKPITPNHLLLLKDPVLPPLKDLSEEVYSRKRWRRVQALAQTFWARWKKEYLHSLHPRVKWQTHQRNLQKGDIVLCVKDDEPRSSWPLARVACTYQDEDGLVRKVRLRFANGHELDRPCTAVVLLVAATN